MSIKILGGLLRGLSFYVPKSKTRPTSVMLRRRFFDANQDWSEYNFIDLCAGTGAMGLEAWSRGASKVLLVERARSVVTTTGKNLDLVRERYPQELEERPVYLQNLDAAKFTGAFKSEYASWSEEQQIKTWIFLDPPYDAHPLYKWFLRTYLKEENWFKGKILVESDTQKGIGLEWWESRGVKITKVYTQGSSYIAHIER
jgi:16S rRNA (guanine966-N2)-methyltransferase